MADLRSAVEKLDNREFKGTAVHCIADVTHLSLPPTSYSIGHIWHSAVSRLYCIHVGLIEEQKG